MPQGAPEPDGVDAPGADSSPGVYPGIAKRRILLAAKLLLAAALFWLLFNLGFLDAGPLLGLLDSWGLLLASAGLISVIWPIAAWRWLLLLQTQNINPSFRDAFKVAYGAAFIGLYLPGAVGSDLARVGLGMSLPRSKLSVLALSVVADRILGIIGLMIVGLVASLTYLTYLDEGAPGYAQLRIVVLVLAGIFAAMLAGLVAVAPVARKLRPRAAAKNWTSRGIILRVVAQVVEAASLYMSQPGRLLLGLIVSILVHVLTLAVLTLLAWGIGLGGVSLWKYAVAGALTVVVNVLPITPGGLGIGEAAFSQLVLLLDPDAGPLPYATVFLAYRVIVAVTLLPALAVMPSPFRRSKS